jgi:FkbM family methyltransferase
MPSNFQTVAEDAALHMRRELRFDRLAMIARLDAAAAVLRRLGLRPVTRVGRRALGKALDSGLHVKWDGFRIHGSIEHRGYLRALSEGRHEAFETNLFKQSVRPGMKVLDIGAFLGEYALTAARCAGSGGKVYAFEPDPRNYQRLCKNIDVNGYTSIIVPVQKAISDQARSASFFLRDGDPSCNSLFQPSEDSRIVTADCIALDDFFSEDDHFDVIKMDIEGAELTALRGMRRILSNRTRRITMFVECNPTALRAAGSSADNLVDLLENFGFTIRLIDEKHERVVPLDLDFSSVKYVNLYCVRK